MRNMPLLEIKPHESDFDAGYEAEDVLKYGLRKIMKL